METPALGRVILGLLRTLGHVYSVLPWSLRRPLGIVLGNLIRWAGLRRRVVEQNLSIAYPDAGSGIGPGLVSQEERRRRILGESYHHFGHLILEIFMVLAPGAMKRFLARSVELRGKANWERVRASGRGAIFVASHVGNWEIMAAAGAASGIDIMIVTKHLKPEWLHQAVEKGRGSYGVRATYEPKTLRDVLSHLKRGGTVGFVLDQYAGPPVGVRVPFFGVPVGTMTAPAFLSKRTGAALLPVVNYRCPDGRMIVDIRPPVAWTEREDAFREIAENTAACAALLERDILSYPEQWLWIHRRFKGDLSPLRAGEWEEGRARH